MAQTKTVGGRVAVRLGGQLFTVECTHEYARVVDCMIYEGGESNGLYLGRVAVEGGVEISCRTVARNAPAATLRAVLVHLGLLAVSSDGQKTRSKRASEAARYAKARRALVAQGAVAA